jgi:hypothetical protein
MTKIAKKFAETISSSVSRELYNRAQELQMKWDAINMKVYGKRFKLADLSEIVWSLGLGILEELPQPTIIDTLATKRINDEALRVQIRKARKGLKAPRTLSGLSDDQVQAMLRGQSGENEE